MPREQLLIMLLSLAVAIASLIMAMARIPPEEARNILEKWIILSRINRINYLLPQLIKYNIKWKYFISIITILILIYNLYIYFSVIRDRAQNVPLANGAVLIPQCEFSNYTQLAAIKTVPSECRMLTAKIELADAACTSLVCQAVRNWGVAEECGRALPGKMEAPGRLFARRGLSAGLIHGARPAGRDEVAFMGADWVLTENGISRTLAYDCYYSIDQHKIIRLETGLYDQLDKGSQ